MTPSRLAAEKSLLRKKLRALLAKLRASQKARKNRRIQARLLGNADFKKAKQVLFYCSMKGEVETRDLIKKALGLKKQVFCPKIFRGSKNFKVFEIKDHAKDLRAGAYGILEPKASKKTGVSKLDLIIVPGLGFDRKGRRLGRGEGYFDRFLKKTPKAVTIGLAFREQIVKKIPTGKHDVPLDQVITD